MVRPWSEDLPFLATNPEVRDNVCGMVKPTAKVVLVEDDAVLADMYVQKFTKEGFQITHALDGVEGLAAARAHRPDIILLDIMMPKKNGIETLKELRADPEFKSTLIVMLSNVGDQTYIDQATELGANAYVMKSNFTPSEVVAKVRDWLKS
jgi:DNA-binding response OmpR family regulator